ncbi:inorganic polyphosphate kinase [Tissierella pigra]|uniref:Inorganic polyphosphate kinase n=1 Tax=Tissierella pigra TaxID=2607614 RepID=A0A6N7Y0D4_9FIRM|nr:inorganic polyphosphate kinase [Tissierella pigra]MSU03203.1 inorganic polyphosphate kinase [Tissierella pigra]
MNSYERIFFKDDISEYPNRVRLTDLGDGTFKIVPEKGEIFEHGTPHSANTMNHLDEGIYKSSLQAKTNKDDITSLAVEVAILKNASLNNITHNIFIVNFANMDSIELVNGVYDETQKRLVI